MRLVAACIAACLTIGGVRSSVQIAPGLSSRRGLYDANPNHLWNRIHETFHVRLAPDGSEYGFDTVDPLVWRETWHLLTGPSHARAVIVLDEGSSGSIDRSTGAIMSLHVIVGAGPVGTATARRLAERGESVRVITRRGTGPDHAAIERVAADATDAARLSALAAGAVALYNCANPLYHRWLTDWPPLASALLAASERSGAVLATVSNLYGYGPVNAPITPATPLAATHPKLRLRAQMWRDALDAHRAGRIRATEVRGSDYIEANSIFSFALAAPLSAGKRAYVPAALDVPHSWTSIADVARTLVMVATQERAWGQAWLVPTNPALTVRDLATRFTTLRGLPAPKLTAVPYPALWAAGLFSPMMRELRATNYQWIRPFLLDSTLTEQTFGLTPTRIDTALAAVPIKAPVTGPR